MPERHESLLRAVQFELRHFIPLREEQCGLRPTGQPPPVSGQLFVSVFPASLTPGPSSYGQHFGMDELHGFGIGITQRTGLVPEDRMYGHGVFGDETGVLTYANKITRTLRLRRFQALQRINDYLVEDGHTGLFVEPYDLSTDAFTVVTKDEDWFYAQPCAKPTELNCRDHGLYGELIYSGLRYMESMPPEDADETIEGQVF